MEISFYEYINNKPKLILKTDSNNELSAVNEFKSMITENDQKTATSYRHLGELSGRVHRRSFSLTVDGIEREFMMITH